MALTVAVGGRFSASQPPAAARPLVRDCKTLPVYFGIDLVFYSSVQALEYDLIAAPGADPGATGIELHGADSIRINQAGDLVISTAAGDLKMRKRGFTDCRDGRGVRIHPGKSSSPTKTISASKAD